MKTAIYTMGQVKVTIETSGQDPIEALSQLLVSCDQQPDKVHLTYKEYAGYSFSGTMEELRQYLALHTKLIDRSAFN